MVVVNGYFEEGRGRGYAIALVGHFAKTVRNKVPVAF